MHYDGCFANEHVAVDLVANLARYTQQCSAWLEAEQLQAGSHVGGVRRHYNGIVQAAEYLRVKKECCEISGLTVLML